ncbi:hypothetical protein [Membranihabitans maritimus]|uniref:hypothetical protein n=1 Tax=Membranihabitans maritimus TaxID=2904244 RepID=UPI001F36FD99|nr:hypothetical protein [Membranihabitans maritimus]
MLSKLSILILFLFCRFYLFYSGEPEHRPLKIVDGWDLSEVSSEESAFSLVDDSTLIEYNVVRLHDEEELPQAYMSEIVTPVCDDTLCALMNIRVYWNLLGNYIGYDTISGKPLTKNDHIEFEEEDYVKLHKLLVDDNSIIKRKEKKELFDQEKTRVSEVVDAVTGATAKEVKEAVVDGALYSCYTLYHIVHGPLSDSIQSDMESHYNISLQEKLLGSLHSDYQLYALKRLDEAEFMTYQNRIMDLIRGAIPLNRLYIMKKMPSEMWAERSTQETISGYYSQLEVNSQSYFLRKLEELGDIDGKCLLNLSGNVESMSRNQLKSYIRILSNNEERITQEVLQQINLALESGKQYYGYLMEEYLHSNDFIRKNQN